MTDRQKLPERLRDYRGGTTEWRELMDAAADRIEQLQGALAPFANGSIDVSGAAVIVGYPECGDALRRARAEMVE